METGFQVVGYCRRGSPELEAAGGSVAGSPADVAAQCDALISILPDVQAVSEVVLGEEGTVRTITGGMVHIEMSTIDVGEKGRIRDAVRAHGGDLLDCPISGSPGMVEPRLATTFASGDPESIDSVRPVLDAISGPWVYAGAFGNGARLKYVANLLLAVHTVAAAEAIVLAEQNGLDLDLVQRTLDSSIASSAIWKQRGPVMRKREWLPAAGPIETLRPILEQIEACAAASCTPTPTFDAAKAVFDQAVADGWGDLDIAAVHDQLSDNAALDRGKVP